MRKEYLMFLFFAMVVITGVSFVGCTESSTKSSSEYTPQLSVDEIKSRAKTISYDELMRHNDNYVGEIIHLKGSVMQVFEISKDKYGLLVFTRKSNSWYYDDDLVLVYYEGERLLEDDIIEIWGRVTGLVTYKTVLGSENTVPGIKALHVELIKKAGEKYSIQIVDKY